jgi:hypothetical protein
MPANLGEVYAQPHQHEKFVDHHLRVDTTIQVARWMTLFAGDRLAADLSCGDGAVLGAIEAMPSMETCFYGDFAPGYGFTGPIEETIHQIPNVDLFINTETLEHLDDPDLVLSLIRPKTKGLVLSTPIDAWQDENREHVWAWSRKGVETMLAAAGFKVLVYSLVDLRPAGFVYAFGIWGCL